MPEEKSKQGRSNVETALLVGAGLGIGLGLLFREMAVGIVLGSVLGLLTFATWGRTKGRGRRDED